LVFADLFSQHLLCDKGQAAETVFGVHGFEEFPDIDYLDVLELLYLIVVATQGLQQAIHIVVEGMANNKPIAFNVLDDCLLDLGYVLDCKPVNQVNDLPCGDLDQCCLFKFGVLGLFELGLPDN
jgi:hypothetical protein